MLRAKWLAFVLLTVVATAGMAQSGRELDSGGARLSGAKYLVFMNVNEARGIKQVRYYVLENSGSGTYSYARNRYDGKKSRLEIVGSGTFFVDGNEITFLPAEGEPVTGIKTDRFININDEYFTLCVEQSTVKP